MKEVVLKIPEKEYQFFMKLIKSLRFVKVKKSNEGDSKEKIIENLKSGFEEMRQFKKGKKEGTLLKDFLDDL